MRTLQFHSKGAKQEGVRFKMNTCYFNLMGVVSRKGVQGVVSYGISRRNSLVEGIFIMGQIEVQIIKLRHKLF